MHLLVLIDSRAAGHLPGMEQEMNGTPELTAASLDELICELEAQIDDGVELVGGDAPSLSFEGYCGSHPFSCLC